MSGHVGDLSPQQAEALNEFKLRLEQVDEKYQPDIKRNFDDRLFLKFLRARKFDVNKAFEMILGTLEYRHTFHGIGVDNITEDMVQNELRIGKSFFWKTDREGRPVVYIRARMHKPWEVDAREAEKFSVYMMETARRNFKPPVETCTIVFDLKDTGVSNIDLAQVKFLTNVFQNFYPESLAQIIILNAPWIFWGLWKAIKGWLDPVTAAKIKFLEVRDLAQFITPENLPIEFGGTNPYQYEYPGNVNIVECGIHQLLAETQGAAHGAALEVAMAAEEAMQPDAS